MFSLVFFNFRKDLWSLGDGRKGFSMFGKINLVGQLVSPFFLVHERIGSLALGSLTRWIDGLGPLENGFFFNGFGNWAGEFL